MAGTIDVVMTDPDWNERWALRPSASVDTESADLCRSLIQSQKRLKLLRAI